MDAVNFLGHLRASRAPVQIQAPPLHAGAVQPTGGVSLTALPHQYGDASRLAQAAKNEKIRAAAQQLPAARPQGLAGKPPFNKERYPASFAGRPKGAKSKAPNRRQMESALAAAVAMRTGNPKYEAESTAPDFLARFGVKRSVVTRLANELAAGNMTMTGAVSSFQESASKIKNLPDGSYVMPATQRLVETETARVGGNQSAHIQTLAAEERVIRVGVAGGQGDRAVGQTSTGFVPGGQIAVTVPSMPPPVSAMVDDDRPLHGAAGAGAMGGAAPGEFPVATTANKIISAERVGYHRDQETFHPRGPPVSLDRHHEQETFHPRGPVAKAQMKSRYAHLEKAGSESDAEYPQAFAPLPTPVVDTPAGAAAAAATTSAPRTKRAYRKRKQKTPK